MTSPALNASGDYAVVYDVGGKELKVVKDDTLLHELTLPDEESILCATVNEKGWVAVTSKASGYKGVVTVYNRDFESVLTIRLQPVYLRRRGHPGQPGGLSHLPRPGRRGL